MLLTDQQGHSNDNGHDDPGLNPGRLCYRNTFAVAWTDQTIRGAFRCAGWGTNTLKHLMQKPIDALLILITVERLYDVDLTWAEECLWALVDPENTHLLRKGKYHCTADLLFDWFGFSCFVELKLQTDLLVWPNPNRPYSDISPYEVSECSLVDPISATRGLIPY